MTARPTTAIWRSLLAESMGAGLLVTVVVGSGIAASRLSPHDVGLQLLENSTATALGLAVLVLVVGPTSGAHLNPVISVVDALLGRRAGVGLRLPAAGGYVAAQVAGGILGALLADAMFGEPVAIATTDRASWPHLIGEVVATAGLVLVVFTLARTAKPAATAAAVGAYIGAAYWFTSSTSFANPAVTIGRMFSDTFAGIAPASVLPFLVAQVVGALIGSGLLLLFQPAAPHAMGGAPVPAVETEKDPA